MEQLQIASPEELTTYLRNKRQGLDLLLRGGLHTLHVTRYVSLAITSMEMGRGWLSKALGSLPENPHPASSNPDSTIAASATDNANPEQIARFWLSDESTRDSRIRRLRRSLAKSTLEMSHVWDVIPELDKGPNGLYPHMCLGWAMSHLHEVSMALGFELEQPAVDIKGMMADFHKQPLVVSDSDITPNNKEVRGWIGELFRFLRSPEVQAIAAFEPGRPPVEGVKRLVDALLVKKSPAFDVTVDSNLYRHAHTELARAGLFAPDSFGSGFIGNSVLALVKTHAEQGHSGGTHYETLNAFNRVVNFQNLTPLTDNPSEWAKVTAAGTETVWQNCRRSDAYSHDGGKTYWIEQGPGNINATLFSEPYIDATEGNPTPESEA